MGAKLGVNYTDVFDRTLSRESHKLESGDTVYYEDNSLISVEIGFDSKKLLPTLPVTFGLDGEFAMSKWEAERAYYAPTKEKKYTIGEGTYYDKDGNEVNTVYVNTSLQPGDTEYKEDAGKTDGNAFYVTPYVKVDIANVEADLKATYLKTDKDFWSEMASAPNYRGGSIILNSNALYSNEIYSSAMGAFGMSSLENLYLSVYNSNPLNITNLMTSKALVNALSNQEESQYLYSKLYNNYKSAHFYRNGYDAGTIKRLELDNAVFTIDPTVNMALPFGLATPDRNGFNVSLNATWNDAVTFNGYFAQIKQSTASVDLATGAAIENTFTEFAVGGSVDIGRLANLDRKILLQGSYDHAEEKELFKRSSDRIMGGASADVWGPFALQAGVQMAKTQFGNEYIVTATSTITNVEEMFVLAGPKVRIAPNSYLTVQYGMLTDKMNLNNYLPGVDADGNETVVQGTDELSINKNVIIADVTVNF